MRCGHVGTVALQNQHAQVVLAQHLAGHGARKRLGLCARMLGALQGVLHDATQRLTGLGVLLLAQAHGRPLGRKLGRKLGALAGQGVFRWCDLCGGRRRRLSDLRGVRVWRVLTLRVQHAFVARPTQLPQTQAAHTLDVVLAFQHEARHREGV